MVLCFGAAAIGAIALRDPRPDALSTRRDNLVIMRHSS